MYQDIKIDDVCLQGKHIIRRRDIINLLPHEVREEVEAAYVYVDDGQPLWVIYLGYGGYLYKPFSGEMIYEPYAKNMDFGRIYFCRKARYLRWQKSSELSGKKVYAVYICRPDFMFLFREISNLWYDDGEGPGYSTVVKWFRAFKHPN